MRNLTQDNITQAVIARFVNTPDARLNEIMTSLVQHLHAFARDVNDTSGVEYACQVVLYSEFESSRGTRSITLSAPRTTRRVHDR
jgi:hypothetical protein